MSPPARKGVPDEDTVPARRGPAAAGSALRPALNQQLFNRLTALGRTAARQLNQLPQPSGRSGGS